MIKDIQSLGGIEGSDIMIVYGDGERAEFVRCPFPQCNFLHRTDMELCHSTGLPIAKERQRWAEKKRAEEAQRDRERLADEARKDYRKKYLSGWMGWREKAAIGSFIAMLFSLIAYVVLQYKLHLLIIWGPFVCAFVFAWMDKRYTASVEKRSNDIYELLLAKES